MQLTEKRKKEMAREAIRKARAAEQAATRQAEKQVMIEKAVNLKLMCDYAVSCSYGDLVLIISMLHDYIRILDEVRGDDIQYRAYYRKRFELVANKLADQIGFDYEAAVEKCRKKMEKPEKEDDVGEEAMVLAYKKNVREARQKEAKNNET